MRLSFLIAGVQKGGTTALHHYLRQHPELFLPARKELHFFDDDGRDWAAPDYADLHRHFTDAPAGAVCGEATPIYTYWPPCLDRIRAYHPGIRLIIALREPAARAHSQWRMEVAKGLETLPFARAIREGRGRLAAAAPYPGFHRVYSYVERGFYAGQLRRVFDRFPAGQVLVLGQQALKDDPRGTLDRVCDHLGVARFRDLPEPAVLNSLAGAGLPPLEPADRAYLEALYRDEIADLRRLTGLRL